MNYFSRGDYIEFAIALMFNSTMKSFITDDDILNRNIKTVFLTEMKTINIKEK